MHAPAVTGFQGLGGGEVGGVRGVGDFAWAWTDPCGDEHDARHYQALRRPSLLEALCSMFLRKHFGSLHGMLMTTSNSNALTWKFGESNPVSPGTEWKDLITAKRSNRAIDTNAALSELG